MYHAKIQRKEHVDWSEQNGEKKKGLRVKGERDKLYHLVRERGTQNLEREFLSTSAFSKETGSKLLHTVRSIKGKKQCAYRKWSQLSIDSRHPDILDVKCNGSRGGLQDL